MAVKNKQQCGLLGWQPSDLAEDIPREISPLVALTSPASLLRSPFAAECLINAPNVNFRARVIITRAPQSELLGGN